MACNVKEDFVVVATKMKKVLHKYGVHSTTIQPEFVEKVIFWREKVVYIKKAQESCALSCQPNCTAELCCTVPATGLAKRVPKSQ
jgi:zinc transporter 1